MTCHVIARPGHVTIPGQRGGGDPSRHRSRDIRFIGREMRALSLIGPMLGREVNYIGKRSTYVYGRAILGHDDRFLLIACLLLILKGYT